MVRHADSVARRAIMNSSQLSVFSVPLWGVAGAIFLHQEGMLSAVLIDACQGALLSLVDVLLFAVFLPYGCSDQKV